MIERLKRLVRRRSRAGGAAAELHAKLAASPAFAFALVSQPGTLSPESTPAVVRRFLSERAGTPAASHPLFDAAYYQREHPEAAGSPADALWHFVHTGLRQCYDPHPLFSTAWYAASNPDVAASGLPPFVHFLVHGARERRDPHPLFDSRWYESIVPQGPAVENLLLDYVTRGARAGLSPHPLFDERWYLDRYPDVPRDESGGLYHYLLYGAREGRRPHPLFDPAFYLAQAGADSPAAANALVDYVSDGAARGLSPHPLFERAWYVQQPDVARDGDPFVDFVVDGDLAGRSPHPFFDGAFYLRTNPDVAALGTGALRHFAEHGAVERRSPHPLIDATWWRSAGDVAGLSALEALPRQVEAALAAGSSPHPLFDPGWYAGEHCVDVRSASEAFRRFVRTGLIEDEDPHPLFSTAWYRASNPDVAATGVPPFLHFLEHGARERRDPHPLFDSAWYEEQLDGGKDVVNLASDFVRRASREAISPHPLFDARWYLREYPDVAAAGGSAFVHYVAFGAQEGRRPHPLFDPDFYRAQAGRNQLDDPLIDYVTRGARRGLSPHPLFDRGWYAAGTPRLAESRRDAFVDFVASGDREGRASHPLFDPLYYLRSNPDVAASGVPPLRHFVERGGAEGRNPHPMFDTRYYVWLHPELRGGTLNPLVHYLSQPLAERRHPHPLLDGAYQRLTSVLARETTIDPLRDYVVFRSNLHPELVARHATSVPPTPARGSLADRDAERAPLKRSPLVSVLLPTYDSAEAYLSAAVDSVRAQTYANWELVVVDDGSSAPHVDTLLETLARRDRRIRVIRRPKNGGISRATNDALRAARGEYVALLDHDDVCMPDALAELVRAVVEQDADAAYSDQAYVSATGRFEEAFHKPDWSPAFFNGVMYVGHLLLVRRELALAAGGFDPAFDRAQDFEFMLRVGERTRAIVHVPRILYHWRRIPGSVAHDADSKGKIEPVQAAAVNAHFARTGFPAHATPYRHLPHRLAIAPLPRTRYPRIDVIVRGDRPWRVREACVRGLRAHPAQFRSIIEIAVAPPRRGPGGTARNGHRPPVPPALVDDLATALRAGSAEYVLFVDPLVERLAANWLDYLVMYAELSDVAFVAPHLYREDGSVASAGAVATASELVPAMTTFRLGDDGYAGSLACDREVSTLAAGLVLADRAVLAAIGGIDTDFATPYYALGEAGLRAADAGYRNIAIAAPIVSVSSDYELIEPRAAVDAVLFADLRERAAAARGDRYYNAAFAAGRSDYVLR